MINPAVLREGSLVVMAGIVFGVVTVVFWASRRAGSKEPLEVPSSWRLGRYVVIRHIANGKKVPVSLSEIQIFDKNNVQLHPLDITYSSVKKGKPGTCPSYAGAFPIRSANAIDRDIRTYLSTDALTDSEFIRFDLKGVYPISRVVVFNRVTCTEFVASTLGEDTQCRTRLDECDLEIQDANSNLVWNAEFPMPSRDIYVFSL
jgi:hypothetical protein